MIKLINEARASKLDKQYYDFVKALVSKAAKLPKGAFEEVSTRDRDHWGFRPDAVTLIINPWNLKRKQKEQVEQFVQNMDDVKKAFGDGCEIIEVSDQGTYSIVVPKETIDSLMSEPDTATKGEEKDTISFWATTVFDTRHTAIAYGAKIKCADGWSFPGSISRIQQKLGEKKFYNFAKGATKSFKSYSQLVKYLKDNDRYIEVPSEEQIINSGYDERYFTN